MNVQRTCWLALTLLVAVAYVSVIAPQERTIEFVRAQAEGYDERAEANEMTVRNASTLQAARARVISDVIRLRGAQSAANTMAHTLRLLGEEGSAFHVDIRSLTPDARATVAPGALVGQDVEIAATGRFRDLVSLAADLPKHDVLIQLHDVRLRANGRATATSPALDATFQATLYRLSDTANSEVSNGTGTLR
jgi:Tfp pilus assembly protein PilO